jgi:polysaccharide biosynthesis/export protein
MHVRIRIGAIVCGLFLSFLIAPGPHFPQTLLHATADYHIGPNDVLTITDYDQADLSGNYTVDTDGTFTFPLIGQIKAGGLTVQQLQAELKKKLANGYFLNPQVNVTVAQYHSQQVYIVGEVRTPGPYTMTGPMTLLQAIAMAGSALPTASEEIMVVRPAVAKAGKGPVLPGQDDDPADVIKVNLKKLQSGDLSQNIPLQDGDTVFVPRADTVYVFGQVKLPGAYPVQPNTTVLQALSLAGGVNDRGSTSRIKIVRFVNGKKEELKVKLSDIVKPGDTVMVPERFF